MFMNIGMKYVKNKYLLILPLLFIASLILHPLEHYASGHFDKEVECEFCINELFEPLTAEGVQKNIFPLVHFSFEIKENVISIDFTNFFSRAPPKI